MEEEVSRIKWNVVFSIIKKRLLWIIAIAVVVALIAGLLTGFVFNAGKDTYTLSFDLKSPSGGGALPDGTAFAVYNLVYSDSLRSVKESSDSFADLDVDALSSGGITVTDKTANTESEGQAVSGARFVLTAKESCFSSYEQADEFMHAVAENFVTLTLSSLKNRNYSAWEQSYALASDYDGRISVLRSQYDYILSVYDGFTSTRAYADYVVGDYTVQQYRAQAAGDISVRLTALSNEQGIYAYVLGDSDTSVLYEAKELERQKQVNTAKITALTQTLTELLNTYSEAGLSTSQMDTFESFHSDIASLTQRNVEIEDELERLYTSIGYVKQENQWVKGEGKLLKAPAAFTDEMQALYTQIAASTQTMSDVVSQLYTGFTSVEFEQARANVTSGGTSTLFVTAAVLVLAAIIAACIFAAAGYRKQAEAEESAALPQVEKKEESSEKESEEGAEGKQDGE